MEKFNYDSIAQYRNRYEDVSEPLNEYNIKSDGSLTETSSSCSLLGVKQNGRWGWINTSGRFVIPPIYDHGFVLCYNGIIILEKNGYYGGLYRDTLTEAFRFKYNMLSYIWRDTYVVWNNNDRCALIKSGDCMLTSFEYKGFSKYNRGNITEYLKSGFLFDSKGDINLETGKEL